ncbi:hypothetical protein [Bacillus sp. FJAT-27251]|uniref:hypothetical protein n=1 Tax=Bacillus sp. FJAT-27251 TaxID=1684142 RepID=UPI0006A76EE4|nr:hypothetical protein [Bacillus sp. FJAT-27251]
MSCGINGTGETPQEHKRRGAGNAYADCSETSKLEAPTKKRSLLLSEELKFVEFLGGEARQAHRPSRGKRSAWNGNQHST